MHLHCFNKVKIVTIYALLVCKIFGLKIRSCNFFDKYQVCSHTRKWKYCGRKIQPKFVVGWHPWIPLEPDQSLGVLLCAAYDDV